MSEDLARAYETVMLALVMWREARGEGRDGQRAVGHVVRNRSKAGWGSVVECIVKKNQFTSMSVPGDGQLTKWPLLSDGRFVDTLHDASRILSGEDGDLTGGALYYANLEVATSGWFFEHIVGDPVGHPVTGVIGRHTFFA